MLVTSVIDMWKVVCMDMFGQSITFTNTREQFVQSGDWKSLEQSDRRKNGIVWTNPTQVSQCTQQY